MKQQTVSKEFIDFIESRGNDDEHYDFHSDSFHQKAVVVLNKYKNGELNAVDTAYVEEHKTFIEAWADGRIDFEDEDSTVIKHLKVPIMDRNIVRVNAFATVDIKDKYGPYRGVVTYVDKHSVRVLCHGIGEVTLSSTKIAKGLMSITIHDI